MATSQILSSYIKKLCHPLKEIRERSLQLLIAKLRLGWQLEDELAGTRELIEALFAWFHVHQPTLQKEALELLMATIKTKAGTYIAKEFDIKKILSTLNCIKPKISPDALETYRDLIDVLRFLNTVESEDNINVGAVTVPPLALHSLDSSDSELGTNSGVYNVAHIETPDTSTSHEEVDVNRNNVLKTPGGLKVLLFPWIDLCASDFKTLLLIEDALKLLKSTRRCCRFIRDVFLQDFPPEIFLNRPTIIKSLLVIADGGLGGRPLDALSVLLSITRSLCARLRQLSCIDLIHETVKMPEDYENAADTVNIELEQIAGAGAPHALPDDTLAALRQLPAPIYALDTLHAVMSIMARSVVLIDSADGKELLDAKELNTCLCLIESLTNLLLQCVSEEFWSLEHDTKTYRDIAHKSCLVMRSLGDILTKYRNSFLEDTTRYHHRVAWLRLLLCAERLLNWARNSVLPPSSLIAPLQTAHIDPAVELLYPELSARIDNVLRVLNSKTSVDQEFKSKYREFGKLRVSMQEAANFMKNKNLCRSNKKVLTCILDSLPALELHLNETYMNDVSEILLKTTKAFDMKDSDWSIARSIALYLMAHTIEWVKIKFYAMLAHMVKTILVGDENQVDNEKSLTLLCDVSILTEICCHGLSSGLVEVESSSTDIMLYLLRGRLVLSDSCWWRLLASVLPVLPLLHVYAAHDTQLGQAILKSLECDIAECMGVSLPEVTMGWVRLLFVNCPPVQMDAAHALCRLLDDDKYLPPRMSARPDVLHSSLRRVQQQDFNIDYNSSPSKTPQTMGLIQTLDVLKQDVILDEHGSEFITSSSRPILDASMRRSTLQQLSVMMRQQALLDTFQQCDGLKVVVATLRMSLMVEDYLAFPECAISCVSILNSVCFTCRYSMAKIPDLPLLLIRVILVFPANDAAVQMAAQVLALCAWSGFALQELDQSRHRVPALPLSVTQRTRLPFIVNSYWKSSPNAEHSSAEWLLSDEDFRAAIRVHWWCACEGSSRVLLGAPPPPAPMSLRPTSRDLALLRAACPNYSCTKSLLALENATSHKQVSDALNLLESYIHLVPSSNIGSEEIGALPWKLTQRFLCAPPASSRDTALLISLLQFITVYMDNVQNNGGSLSWIKSSFIGPDASVIALLSRKELYPQQTTHENIEVSQLHIQIIRVLLRFIIMLEKCNHYDVGKMESLVKILLACLEKIDLRNFHMLGYLNELSRCVRYALNSRYCKLSEDTALQCLKVFTDILGCSTAGGCKGQACRLDAMLSLLALLKQMNDEDIPVQRWCDVWNSAVLREVVNSCHGTRADLRAAALRVMAALALHAPILPQLMQAVAEESLSQFAANILTENREANAVRTAAAVLLSTITTRVSSHTNILECEVLEQLKEHQFLECCLEILTDICEAKQCNNTLEPNVPITMLERRAELEVRAQKCSDVSVTPSPVSFCARPPPTPSLVVAVVDVICNVSSFPRCPVKVWNDRGLYRLLFRCASSFSDPCPESSQVRGAACRALNAGAALKCVRATLADTGDCLHVLFSSILPFDEAETDAESVYARTHVLLLLGTLLSERQAADTMWRSLDNQHATPFLHSVLQCLQSDDTAMQRSALYCLTKLSQTAIQKNHPSESRVELLDHLKSPLFECSTGRSVGGECLDNDCTPEYMIEEICKVLIRLYTKPLELSGVTGVDEQWKQVCSCLASVLSISHRCRLYGLHRDLPRVLMSTVQTIRDRLPLQSPSEVIKSAANNPYLRALYCLLTIIDCQMLDCVPAKESFAENNLAVSLFRLWPWCMLTEQHRTAVLNVLLTFCNDCPKAWSSMSTCVGGRCLVGEVCALTAKEASQQSRPRSDALLLSCIRTLRHVMPHQHCRAIILKSEILVHIYKTIVRERNATPVALEWARACESAARHADGTAVIMSLRPLHAAPAVRALLMPAVAHTARYRRAAVLQSADLLELLSGTLLVGDTSEVVSAARAVWALAANNHKAKLMLRSAGIVLSVQSAVQRMQRLSKDPENQRALQLLVYTNTVLQTT